MYKYDVTHVTANRNYKVAWAPEEDLVAIGIHARKILQSTDEWLHT